MSIITFLSGCRTRDELVTKLDGETGSDVFWVPSDMQDPDVTEEWDATVLTAL
jgi:hypothetical protein